MQLPHVNRILIEYELIARDIPGSAPVRHHLAAMLLSASRFSTTSWKAQAVKRAKSLLDLDTSCYLHAWAAHRESVLIRMLGSQTESNKTLERFIHSKVLPGHDLGLESNARYNAQRADLVVSYAQNLIQDMRLATARTELCEWLPLNPTAPSAMERIALRGRNITLGKILRYEGRFQEALTFLEEQLKNCEDDEFYEGTGWRRVLLSNVADLYTELDRPADAEAILEPELKQMKSKGQQNISSGRRLQLSLTETFMRRGIYDQAKACLVKLRTLYESIAEPDILTRSGIFRTWTSMARIAHYRKCWDESLFNWRKALEVLEVQGWGGSFSGGLVKCSIAYVLFKLGQMDEGLKILNEGRINLNSEEQMFWIVGFNSYWHDHILQRVNESFGV